jgi:hypothetical protein
MTGKRNLSASVKNRNGASGPSLRRYANPLDQARAASMADEGGAAGAHADAADPDWPGLVAQRGARRARLARARPWLLAASLLGVAVLAAGWLLRRRA